MGRPPTDQTQILEIERFAYEALERTGSTRSAWSKYTEGRDEDEDHLVSESTFRKYARAWERNYVRLDSDEYIEPWGEDWLHDLTELGDPVKIDDPTRAEVLLTLQYCLEALPIPDPKSLTRRQAKFALLLHNFFDLSKRRDVLALLVIAHEYATVDRRARASGHPPDQSYMRALDESLMVYSGRNPGPPDFHYWLPVDPSVTPSEEEETEMLERNVISIRSGGGLIVSSTKITPIFDRQQIEDDEVLVAERSESFQTTEMPLSVAKDTSQTMVDLWKQIDWTLAMTDQQSFIAEGGITAKADEDWDDSKEKVLFDARENAIQEIVNLIYATPEGKAAHEQFLRETNIVPRVRISGPWS